MEEIVGNPTDSVQKLSLLELRGELTKPNVKGRSVQASAQQVCDVEWLVKRSTFRFAYSVSKKNPDHVLDDSG